MNRWLRLILFLAPGIILIILAVVLGWIVLPNLIRSQVEEQVKLIQGTETWNNWKEAPIPIFLNFYVYHVTNPDEVEDGYKPILKEMGPYVYKQRRLKVDLSQPHGPNTVKYKEVRTFHFDQTRSGNNSESDVVNIVNIPFVAVLNTVSKQIPLDLVVGLVGNFLLFQENLIRREVRVKDLLFEGFDVTKYTDGLLGSRLPEAFSGGRFGLYKGQNGSASKEWEIYTGYDNNFDHFGKVKSWDGRSQLGFWKPYSECDHIKGSDGSVFRPFLTRESVLEVFGAELCSSLSIVHTKDVDFKGILGFRFGAGPNVDIPQMGPKEQSCYCLEKDPEKCPWDGVIPLEACLKAPLYSSFPYFLHADVRYLAQTGLPPGISEKHETFLDLEPTTGILLRAHKRVQMNLEVKSNRKVRALRHLTQESFLFPILWADENAELTDDLVAKIRSQLLVPLSIIEIGKWVALGVGVLILLLGLILFIIFYVVRSPNSDSRPTRPDSKSGRLSSLIWRGSRGSGSVSANENGSGNVSVATVTGSMHDSRRSFNNVSRNPNPNNSTRKNTRNGNGTSASTTTSSSSSSSASNLTTFIDRNGNNRNIVRTVTDGQTTHQSRRY